MTEEVLAGAEDAAQEETVAETQQAGDQPEKTGDPKVDDPWPKSARNKISRLEGNLRKREAAYLESNRKIAEMQRQLEELQRAQQPKEKEPREEDFETYGDYLKALVTQKPEDRTQETVDPEKIKSEAFTEAQRQLYYESRFQRAVEMTQKAAKEIPGFAQTYDENSDILDALPDHVSLSILETDNPAIAIYALAKEGRLEALSQMSPTQAAMEIARAQIRGEQMTRPQVTKAPPPIDGARGTSSARDTGSMSGKELRKHYGQI